MKTWLEDKFIMVIHNERKFDYQDFNKPIQLKIAIKFYKLQ